MYWTLDNRPPTLDERIIQAKARHAERVEQIAAEEPVPQLEVPEAPSQSIQIGPTFTVRPGHYFEISEESLHAYQQLRQLAAQQNMNAFGLQGRGYLGAAAQQASVGLFNPGASPGMTEAQHMFQVTKDGTRRLSSRGPFYHPPTSLGTLTEFS